MPIVTDQNIVPLAVAVLAGIAGIVGAWKGDKAQKIANNAASIASDAHDAATDAKQTAVDNHAETRARLDDLETGRVPVNVTETAGEGT